MEFTYWKSCPELTDAEVEIQSRMIADAAEVTYETFRQRVGGEDLARWAASKGYLRNRLHGVTLKSDWHVAYYRSTWDGRRCYYLVWSAMEFIWLVHE